MTATDEAVTRAASRDAPALRRTMRFGDVVLFLVVAVVAPRWIATAAATGPSALVVWAIGFVGFFVPLGLTVIELTRRFPQEGGMYVWAREAFGDFAGFMTAWLYWCSNLVFFPALLYFTAGNALYAAGPGALAHSSDPAYFVTVSLGGLLLAFALNLVGLDVGKWLHNLGAIGTWAPITLLIAAGAVAFARFGPATPLSGGALLPGTHLADFALWSTIAFAFAGLEIASFMGEEVVDARRTIPRALLLTGVIVTALYVLGTAAVLVAIPAAEVSGLQGVMQAIARTGERAGFPAVTGLVAVLITLGSLGSVGAWLASVARLPFVVGLDRHLPAAFARLHPRWGTPYWALIVQTVGAALFTLLGQAGSSVRGAYDALNSMALIVSFVPYLVVFAAAIRLDRGSGAASMRPLRIALAALGFATTAFSIGLALIPTESAGSPGLAIFKVAGGSAAIAAVGAALYARRPRRS